MPHYVSTDGRLLRFVHIPLVSTSSTGHGATAPSRLGPLALTTSSGATPSVVLALRQPRQEATR